MPGNNDPIYSRIGDVTADGTTVFPTAMVTATGDYTGAATQHVKVFTADATNGGFIQRLRFKATGTNIASVVRIYLNNGSTNTTAANNQFYGELSLPATTAINTAATVDLDYPMFLALPAAFRIFTGLATTVTASWVPTAIGGKY